MTTPAEAGGYVLQGALGSEDVRALFERCASLRFTGLLELSEGPRRTSVPFVEGEPLDGPDLFKLGAVWRRGNYRLVQRAVDMQGNLTEGVVVEGSLGEIAPLQVFRHCEEGRLSADIDFQSNDGQRAKVKFVRGRMESAEVNGQPNMAALTTIGAWSGGNFKLLLAPLFEGQKGAVGSPSAQSGTGKPSLSPARPIPSDMFDITTKVPLWQVDGEEEPAADMFPDTTPPPVAVPASPSSPPVAGGAPRPSLFAATGRSLTAPAVNAVRPNPFGAAGRPSSPLKPPTPGLGSPTRPAPSFARPLSPPQSPGEAAAATPAAAAKPLVTPPLAASLSRPPAPAIAPQDVVTPPPSPAPTPSIRPGGGRMTILSAVVPAPPPFTLGREDSESPPPDSEWDSTVETLQSNPEPTVRIAIPDFGAESPRTNEWDFELAPAADTEGSRIGLAPSRPMVSESSLEEQDPQPLVAEDPSDTFAAAEPELFGSPFVAPPELPPPPPIAPPPSSPASLDMAAIEALPSFPPGELEIELRSDDALVSSPQVQVVPPPPVAPFIEPPIAPSFATTALPTPGPMPSLDDLGSVRSGRGGWIAVVGVLVAGLVAVVLLWPKTSNTNTPTPPVATTADVKPAPPKPSPPAVAPAPTAPVVAAVPDEAQRLILAARKATIEGKKKPALKLFKAAFKLNPKDPAFAIYVPMTLGKTGKAKLLLDGKGVVITVDGHAFKAPKKLSIAAGPHTVEVGGKVEEITLDKGVTEHLPATGVVPTVAAPPIDAAAPAPPIAKPAKPGRHHHRRKGV